MLFKKPWSKPELRRVRVSEQYDPSDGLTRAQWKAARDLQRRAGETRQAPKVEAGVEH